ncbi:hypothetical protein [Streptomyces sp. NPDC102437]|uniref:hypothetical protein n=1 Tax=Streptomyces sp. NPDC102437 TaxID=3366175 RepID=UPI00382ED154
MSATVTELGMVGLFFIPAAASRRLPDVIRRGSRRTGTAPGEAEAAVDQAVDCPERRAAGMLRVSGGEEENVSEHDDASAAEAALRKAVEQLSGNGTSDGDKAAEEAVQALADGSGQAWTPGQEAQIRAMVDQIRKLQDLNRPGGGWWRRRREWRARERLVDLMMAGGPELLNEAELRHWKSHAMVELLLRFIDSPMKQDDTVETLARIEALHAVTYEEYQQARKKLADEKAAAG